MAALSSLAFHYLAKPLLTHSSSFRTLHRLTCSFSTSSSSPSSLEFNISFATPKPKPKLEPKSAEEELIPDEDDASGEAGQLFIPWIVRGEDGNLKLQAHPPASLLQAVVNSETGTKKMKQKAEKSTVEPKHSKAARRFYNENFRDSGMRLSKVLAAAGVASRRNSEELIFEGKVTVNGSVCNTPQTKVDPAKDVIYVNGNRLPKKQPPKMYFALNKPKGYICSSGEESKSVISLFDDYLKNWSKRNPGVPRPRLFTVGRLDVATTGLIIVTNDGDFAQRLSHPSSNLSKEYIATIDGAIHKRHLTTISEGTTIEGLHCVPDVVELLPRQPDAPRARLRIVVHDGRKHEVRELVKSAGLEVHSLKRVRIGGFKLPSDLGIGKHIELKPTDLKALR
ncbi:hypothetical protein QN277_011382 [Acacia crassicarpa]|nr:hypothetical protein QN277_011382 [Acacia crassicarpa]